MNQIERETDRLVQPRAGPLEGADGRGVSTRVQRVDRHGVGARVGHDQLVVREVERDADGPVQFRAGSLKRPDGGGVATGGGRVDRHGGGVGPGVGHVQFVLGPRLLGRSAHA